MAGKEFHRPRFGIWSRTGSPGTMGGKNEEELPMKTVEVVAAVIKKEDAIFATQRGYGDFAGGWEFPGGKIEQGETVKKLLSK